MNTELVQGLRDLLAFVEANDDFDFQTGSSPVVTLNWRDWYFHNATPQQRREMLADLAKRLGSGEKVYYGDFFWFKHSFGPHVLVDAACNRETVCERVVVGKKLVPAHGEIVLPAEPEKEIDIVEWNCHSLLADPDAPAEAAQA
jgi:hypothetical protein